MLTPVSSSKLGILKLALVNNYEDLAAHARGDQSGLKDALYRLSIKKRLQILILDLVSSWYWCET